MIVTCPACSTRYLVDPRALGSAGRMVRCANCANTWHQGPPEDFPRSLELAPAEIESSLSAPRYPPPALPPHRRSWVAIFWWVLVVLVLSGAAVGFFARDWVAAMWPPAARLYGLVGFPVAPPGIGLEFGKMSPRRDVENGVPVLIIEGEVINSSNVARDVPKLKVILSDRNGNEVQSWSFGVADPRLLPGAREAYRTSVPRPSTSAANVAVVFDEGG